jgi:hypothetical protein
MLARVISDGRTGVDQAGWRAARGEVFLRELDADPARHLAGCPGPITALFAVPAVMRNEAVSAEEAARQLVAEVTERPAGLDVFEQETVVARVQRAVWGERSPVV